MEKKAGKILIFLLLVSQSLFGSDSSIVLRMQDMNHKPIDQAMCQAPFILQVELKNLDEYTDAVLMRYIPGIESFKSSRSMVSHNVSIDNGKKTTKNVFDFILRADAKGNFTVGPLILTDKNGRSVKSNRLIVSVADEVISSAINYKEKYFLKVFTDKKQAYVGEKIKLHIQFYDRLFVDVLHLKFPEFENVYLVKNKKNAKKSLVEIDGQEYSLTEWIFDMYANQAGACIMQDITAAFFAPELANKFTFGGAFDFFRSLHKTEQYLAANPVKIEIMPLPEHKDYPHVHAVGQFSKFVISAQQNSAQVGQGITLTTELFGDANFEIMDKVPLVLPENFNYYDSNMVTIDEDRNYKKSEFIVQASSQGNYHIQPQTLVYFDPVAVRYKKLQSNGLDITISQAAQGIQDPYVSDDQTDLLLEEHTKGLQDFKIIYKGCVYAHSQTMIPLHRFQQLLWLLCLLWLMLFFYRTRWYNYIIKHNRFVKYKIFFQARAMCKKACADHDCAMLHDLFTKLFAQLLHVNIGQLQDADMVQYLVDKNFSLQQIQAWKNFYHKILQASFSSDVQFQQKDLHQAFTWIQLLKDKS